MEAMVQNTARLVQVIGSGTGSGAETGQSGSGTSGAFVQLLNQSLHQGDAAVNHALPANVAGLIAGLTPNWMTTILAGNGADGNVTPEQLLSRLLASLQGDNAGLGELLQQDPEVQDWMAVVEEVLQLLQAGVLESAQVEAPIVNVTPTVEADDASGISGHGANRLVETIQNLLSAMKRNPDQPILAELAAKFQELIKPVMAQHPELFTAAQSVSGESRKQPVIADNGKAVMEGQSGTQQAADNKAGNTATRAAHVEVPVQHVKVENSKAKLEVLAAKAFINPLVNQPQAEVQTDLSSVTAEQADAPEMLHSMTTASNDAMKASDEQLAPKPQRVSAERFVQEMSQAMLRSMKVTTGNGVTEAKIVLFPEHLGQVDVKISIQQGQVVAQFMADTVYGKELLESQLAQLRSALQSQGLQVNKLEVTQSENLQSGMFHDQRQQQSSQQFKQQKNNQSAYGYDLTVTEFAGELDAIQQLREIVAGSSFHATA